ncbi:D-alanyl-D-alanine carboxypeptidase family protein [Saccharibacillus sp. JS10]|uniref:D-alanyl-D-alanine carboxypeptidase family protein n=1 Tax=Saccharibacillus sp. JS10 TaxID=2950552 RepID=UPI00210B27E4|nr:D-alanyl-D-alanine carboxypeptidase [Saccharibacillus sp. JS10]MCQ4085616.1 D-alanyl-D-alanine carboxypeptidase [Saccharibacillus sp. JS10]
MTTFKASAIYRPVKKFGKKIVAITVASVLTLSGSLFAAPIQAAQISTYESLPLASTSASLSSGLYSSNAILIRMSDGQILMTKNINQRVYPASMTKMMTALVALENISNLQAKTTLPASMFAPLEKQGASMAGFKRGEKVKAIDLLYGSMLPSGADASVGLTYAAAGSQAAFVKKMNQKAKQLGMKHTHFTNVTGLPDPQHYTTVKDMSILMKAALKNTTFRKLITTHTYSMSPTNLHPKGMTVKSTLSESASTLQFKGGKILGGKTGYTSAAGLCLASIASINGKEYMLVTANAKGNPWTPPYHIQDALKVYGKVKN